MTTPLALFTYNRPAHTRRALDALARCARLDEVELILYSDGPRTPQQAEAVQATRAVLHDFAATHPARIVERAENRGLAGSIASAVGELTAAHGRVIVLEDDLVVAPDFLGYMLTALDRYAAEPQVMQVSGCLIAGDAPGEDDALFLPVTTTWGWATWARAWEAFERSPADPALLDRDPAFRSRFTLDGAGDAYLRMLSDRLAGRNDSWGILWWFAVARQAGQVLYPRRSLVWNGGFDSSGVHCGGTETFRPDIPEPFRAPRLPRPIRLPAVVATDIVALTALTRHLAPPQPPVVSRVMARLSRIAAHFKG